MRPEDPRITQHPVLHVEKASGTPVLAWFWPGWEEGQHLHYTQKPPGITFGVGMSADSEVPWFYTGEPGRPAAAWSAGWVVWAPAAPPTLVGVGEFEANYLLP